MKPWMPSPWNSVTAFLPGAMPRATLSGVQVGSLSSSAKQNVYLPGPPSTARSSSPGRPPPTLRMMSCKARPMVAFARLPWPRQLMPEFMPISRAIGPLTTRIGPEKQVVHTTPCIVASGSSAASSAARTTGMYSGLQPARTALMATFSTVIGARLGGTRPITSSGLRRGAFEHAHDARVGRRHDGQAVGPAAVEAGFDLVVPFADDDAAGGEAGVAVAGDELLPDAGLARLRAAAGAHGRQTRAEIFAASHALPFGAIPSERARDFLAVLKADHGRHRLDLESERLLQRRVVHRSDAAAESWGRPGSTRRSAVSSAASSPNTCFDHDAGFAFAFCENNQAGCR